MDYQLGNLKICVEKDYDAMSKRAAEVYAAAIKSNPTGSFGFATGGTPVGLYKELIAMYTQGGLDFSGIKSFNLDEYYPIQASNDQSYRYFMDDNLFKHVNINPSNINIPNGEAPDIAAECKAYEAKLTGIELQLLGIGLNGHIGFNEPAEDFPAATHYVELDESTIAANARFFPSIDDVPKTAVTMGIKSIMMAKEILLVVNGEKKSGIVNKMLFGEITPRVPASVLQLHRSVTVVLDEAAAAEISEQLKNAKQA